MTERLLHPVLEACAVLGVGRSMLYELIASGELESVSIGRRRLVPHDALEDYVARLRGLDGQATANGGRVGGSRVGDPT